MKLPVFFKKEKSISINKLFPKVKSNIKINDVATLSKSKKFDLTFFDSIKYKSFARRRQSSRRTPNPESLSDRYRPDSRARGGSRR